ncbi:MAG: hypothetical protein OER88_02790, partial [Planctomycetota bacterium]|nr:hypothetical protein [Planctomycetota bacterium]
YLAQRARIDPDGSFLKEMMNEWIDLRLQHTGFYARASLAMFLATVNDPRGHEMMKGFSQKGPYFSQFFPFVRAHLVHWNAVEPMVRHYLETGDVEGKTEAGYTLLVYEAIFELGRDLLDKHEADIREAFLTIRRQLRAPDRRNPILLSVGTTAMQGLAMLALRGDKGVRTVLRKMRPVEVPFHVEPMRAARYVAGIKPYPRPTSNAFLNLPDSEQLYLWRGSHLRAAVFHRELASDARPEVADDFREAMKFVRASYQTNHFLLRGTALVVLNRVGTERDKEVIEQALAGGGIPSLYATCLLDPEDPVPTLLPAVGSMAAWTAALAAVTLAGVGENSALQR